MASKRVTVLNHPLNIVSDEMTLEEITAIEREMEKALEEARSVSQDKDDVDVMSICIFNLVEQYQELQKKYSMLNARVEQLTGTGTGTKQRPYSINRRQNQPQSVGTTSDDKDD